LPPLGIFHKPKKQENEKTEMPLSENPENTESTTKEENTAKIYLKAIPLRDLADLENIKNEVKNGNILILRITPLASKNIEDVKKAVNELYAFTESLGGDIARLGEERIVICPQNIRIWREKTPVTSEPVPTAA
jgi:SepF-like predicted cell division protein (DUF552 family)